MAAQRKKADDRVAQLTELLPLLIKYGITKYADDLFQIEFDILSAPVAPKSVLTPKALPRGTEDPFLALEREVEESALMRDPVYDATAKEEQDKRDEEWSL